MNSSRRVAIIENLMAPVIGIIILATCWEVAHRSGFVDPTLLPSIPSVAVAMIRFFITGAIWRDTWMTLARAFAGFILAILIGVPVGTAMGIFRPFHKAMLPMVDFFRSIPVTTLYPIFVLVLGVRDKSKIGMIFAGCVFVIMLNSAYGVLQSSPVRRQMAKLYGCSAWQSLRWITLYEALPQTLIGLRVALSLSLIVAVLGEMFMGAQSGLGQRLTDAYTTFAIDQMYALVILTGFIGLILNRMFVRIEAKIAPWTAMGS